jgi:hypothetical protein
MYLYSNTSKTYTELHADISVPSLFILTYNFIEKAPYILFKFVCMLLESRNNNYKN